MRINWFPGHMAKAHRLIKEQAKIVDVVIELRDARIPLSSANPVLGELVHPRPVIIVFNKAALAEAAWTERWVCWYSKQNRTVVPLDAVSGQGVRALTAVVAAAGRPYRAVAQAKGIIHRPVRAMIVGIPNVGKSTLVNRLVGTVKAKTGDKPGVTRGQQWLRVGKKLELLDTPGILWPKLDDADVAFKLAVTGAIPETAFDIYQVGVNLLSFLRLYYPDRLRDRYDLPVPLSTETHALLEQIAARRGLQKKGGLSDIDRAVRLLWQEFKSGRLGPFTLEKPAEDFPDGVG